MLAVMLCRWSSQLLECEMRLSARVFRLAPTTFYTSSDTVATIVVAMTRVIAGDSLSVRVISVRKQPKETEMMGPAVR